MSMTGEEVSITGVSHRPPIFSSQPITCMSHETCVGII